MILLVDNYDSFSYNLVQLMGGIAGEEIKVIRNDEMTAGEVMELKPSHIILSPGPGRPIEAGILEELVKTASGAVPLLGVCLGHQGICEAFGAEITYAKKLMHGKQSTIRTDREDSIFAGLPESIRVARYHSLAVRPDTLPDCLRVLAVDLEDGEIMAVRHREYPVYGLQFHPESVLTPDGEAIMRNFLTQ